jgi:hypothetical protein
MSETSSYLDYLPPFYGAAESDPHGFLGRFLLIFEKILTGVGDSVPLEVTRGAELRQYPPFEKIIDDLPDVFSIWRTRHEGLPWLASWAALEYPEDWFDANGTTLLPERRFEARKLLAGITAVYQQRWTKKGLRRYLQLFDSVAARPRIAIDDGESLWRMTSADDGTMRLCALAYARPAQTGAAAALLHPTAVAVASSPAGATYVIADAGRQDIVDRRPSLWRVAASGEFAEWKPSSDGQPTVFPVAINSADNNPQLLSPVAISVDSAGRILALDQGDVQSNEADALIYRYSKSGNGYSRQTVISGTAFNAVFPVDMVAVEAGKFMVLDRGTIPGLPNPPQPKLILVAIQNESPLQAIAQSFPLTGIVEPTALVRESDNRYVVVDAGAQRTLPGQAIPYPDALRRRLAGDLVRVTVDPLNPGTPPTEQSLLDSLAIDQNLLVQPTGVVIERPGVFLVCDTGLKRGAAVDQAGATDSSNRVMAEPTKLVRIILDPGGGPPAIFDVTPDRAPIQPVKMTGDGSAVIIADFGDSRQIAGLRRDWRAFPHEFGVSVHFSAERPTTNADRDGVLRQVRDVVDQQKPAHSAAFLQF